MALFSRNKSKVVADAEQREAMESNSVCGLSGKMQFKSNNDQGALALSGVYCAVEAISNSIASMPIMIKDKDTAIEFDREYSLGYQNKFMFVKSLMTDLLLYGNSYAYIIRKLGKVIGLRYLPSKSVTVFYNESANELYYASSLIGGRIESEDIIHLYKNSRDGIIGIGVLTLASRTIQLANTTENSAADYYNGGLNCNGILHAKSPMNKKQAEQAILSVEGNIELGKGKTIKFIPFDLDFQTLSTSAKEAALTETRVFNIEEIARYFNISPIMLQDLSHGNYSSVEAANLSFLTQTLQPFIYLFEAELNKKLIDKAAERYIDFDETALLRTDLSSTATYYTSLVDKGIISRNECRIALGYNPVEGADDLMVAYTDTNQNKINNDEGEETSPENDDK